MADDEQKDPSVNVLRLVENAVKYLEDLHNVAQQGVDDKLKMYFEFTKQLMTAESDRLNALRAEDVKTVGTANDRAVKQAEVLATNVSTSAEVLRGLVAQTAATIAQQLALVTTQLIDRIAALEKELYTNQGKSGASSTLLDRVDKLETSKSEISGANKGAAMTKGNLVTAITITIAIISVIFLLIDKLTK